MMSTPSQPTKISNRRRMRLAIVAALAGSAALYAPTASAGDLLGGLHALFGAPTAGTIYRAGDYERSPHRNAVPAVTAPYTMPTQTLYAPYENYVEGGSVVHKTPIAMNEGHGHGIMPGAAHPVTAKPAPGHKHHFGKTYVRLKGVNRKTYSCTGYQGRPESFTCVVKRSEYIPRQGPWYAISSLEHGH